MIDRTSDPGWLELEGGWRIRRVRAVIGNDDRPFATNVWGIVVPGEKGAIGAYASVLEAMMHVKDYRKHPDT
jgi:hypothetical protein